jgi:hypothetical protein
MMGLPACYCAHLAGISAAEKIYLVFNILIIIYPALSAAIWGRDGMDGGRAFWMMFPISEAIKYFQMQLDLVDV